MSQRVYNLHEFKGFYVSLSTTLLISVEKLLFFILYRTFGKKIKMYTHNVCMYVCMCDLELSH